MYKELILFILMILGATYLLGLLATLNIYWVYDLVIFYRHTYTLVRIEILIGLVAYIALIRFLLIEL